MEFFTHIYDNYKDNLTAMGFAYIGILSIIAMFLPKNNILNKILNEIKSLFKK
jgi:hypothetical protein|tara:strand:+ start:113 stop:271 length:159 start_codon:yes stop_codon:yes gene_type:complete